MTVVHVASQINTVTIIGPASATQQYSTVLIKTFQCTENLHVSAGETIVISMNRVSGKGSDFTALRLVTPELGSRAE